MLFLPKTSPIKVLPDFIIIGAMKCGTTSLHFYLDQHPQIAMSRQKELHFFVQEKNWQRGIEWYKSQFKDSAKVQGEASPSYSAYPKWLGVPERIHAIVPDAKLIYILRDPIERTISNYLHRWINGIEEREINQALAEDFANNQYIFRSQYYMQIQKYLPYFARERLLIITLEELSAQPQATLKKVFDYLNVDSSYQIQVTTKKLHKSNQKVKKNSLGQYISKLPLINKVRKLPHETRWHIERLLYRPFSEPIEKPQLDPELRQKISNYLQDDISRLRDYTGNDFSQWTI